MGSKRLDSIKQAKEKAEGRGVSIFQFVDTAKLSKLGITQYKAIEGSNFIRVIPPKDESKFFAKEVYIHRQIGPDGATFVCPKKMFDKRCPICEDIIKIRREDASDERISELVPKRNQLMFVIDVTSDSTIDKGLRWFVCPMGVLDDICKLSVNRRTGEIIDISDPDEGRDVIFTRAGTKINTRYSGVQLEDTGPAPEDWDSFYDDVPDFDSVLKETSYDKLYAEYFGVPTEDNVEESEDESEESAVDSRRGRGRRLSRTSESDEKESEDKSEESIIDSKRGRGGRSGASDIDEGVDGSDEEEVLSRSRRGIRKRTSDGEEKKERPGENIDSIRDRLRSAKRGK